MSGTCQREACSCCGSVEWREGIFANGRITCAACAREIRLAHEKAQPTPPKQTTLAEWLAPLPSRGVRP
jgi:hypothetical protein